MAEQAVGRSAARFALTGHSGAGLTLIEADGQTFVRKQARTVGQSARLTAQYRKLRQAHAAGISCPQVYRWGEEDGLAWFDMEFIPAESLAHALIVGREPDWDNLLPQIAALPEMYRRTTKAAIPPAQFNDKLASVAAACLTNTFTAPSHHSIVELAARLQTRDWSAVPESGCHGDFTLENLLVQADGRVVMIDFDVPEQCSWWLDVAKLFQDLTGHWCLRHLILSDPEGMATLNAQLAVSRAALRFEAVFAPMIPGGMARLRSLVAFHLMRTLPYARNRGIVGYVLQRIGAVLDD